jgi:tryptophan synthase beta chain
LHPGAVDIRGGQRRAQASENQEPDGDLHFGQFGGMFVPETLMANPLRNSRPPTPERPAKNDPAFQAELDDLLHNYVGRPTPLYFAERWTEKLGGAKIYLKREDLLHTGAHKINNALGQILLAKRLGKKRIIAETGAGQHGVATATVCARFGMECVVYMGKVDMERQALNVARMRLIGAEVRAVTAGQPPSRKPSTKPCATGSPTSITPTTSSAPPRLASVSDDRARFPPRHRRRGAPPDPRKGRPAARPARRLRRRRQQCHRPVPPFLGDETRPHGRRRSRRRRHHPGRHAARFQGGKLGVLQGTKTWLLANDDGQIELTHSVSAGLDYAAVGPEHAYLQDIGRVEYTYATDDEALAASRNSPMRGHHPRARKRPRHGLRTGSRPWVRCSPAATCSWSPRCPASTGSARPTTTSNMMVPVHRGMRLDRDAFLRRLVGILYERNDIALERGRFRARGDVVEVFPAYFENTAVRVEFFGDEIDRLCYFDPLTGSASQVLESYTFNPAKQFVTPAGTHGARRSPRSAAKWRNGSHGSNGTANTSKPSASNNAPSTTSR